ncbi:MAG: ATP-binding protein [Synergistaceae bacterium]|nr:ATP-binding protein [Synergistaceae bacterium]
MLDIAENGVSAGASDVAIEITEDAARNILSMTVEDNGRGMSPEFLERAADPFATTRTTRRVGMGLPFLKQSAELCDGAFSLSSALGRGTRTEAVFAYDSIDRPPLGDMASTVMVLIMGHPEVNWRYLHKIGNREFSMTTEELVDVLEERELLRTADVGLWIRDQIAESLADIARDSRQDRKS